jgi:methanogenic corrinoid protein MtbC1
MVACCSDATAGAAMIRWCAYCQRYQGEAEPFDHYAITHTICGRCVTDGAYEADAIARIEPIRAFFERVPRSGTEPGLTAAALVDEGAALGIDPVDLLLGIVQPVLHRIGHRWARSEATVAEEHRVTMLCGGVIQRIVEGAGNQALRNSRTPDVLLTVVDGNQHTLGVQILEVMLLRSGVSTFAVYPGLPPAEIVALARTLRPRVVAISAALPQQIQPALEAAERLAGERAGGPPVVVGGLALRGGMELPRGAPLLARPDVRTLLDLVSRTPAAPR